jgi:putative transcriptional regulator
MADRSINIAGGTVAASPIRPGRMVRPFRPAANEGQGKGFCHMGRGRNIRALASLPAEVIHAEDMIVRKHYLQLGLSSDGMGDRSDRTIAVPGVWRKAMTTSEIDTVDALMAHYAAGMLPEPARVLVEAHLEMKPVHRATVAAYEAVAGDLMETMDPVSIEDPHKVLSAIFSTEPGIIRVPQAISEPERARWPKVLRDFAGFDEGDIPWRWKLPGLKEYSLGKIDGCDVSFFRTRPGRAIPEHTHDGFELSLVLHGAFNDVRGRFSRGDISVADESLDHRPVAEGSEHCIVFAVTNAPLRLRGSLGRRLGDLLG